MKTLLFAAVLLFFSLSLHSQIIYVTPDGAGLKDGTSWADALDGNSPAGNGYTKVANAIRGATSGSHFWIAMGTYKACLDNDRNKSFEPAENINLFGGFAGNETELGARDWVNNKTYLNGNIGDENLTTDNTYSVVKTSGSNWTLFSGIDGFCIVNGNANGQGWYTDKGGGVFSSQKLTINNCEINNCNASQAGGGAYNYGYGIIHISNTQFHHNSSYSGGGFCYGSSSNYAVTGAILTNCIISNNSGSGSGGISNGGVTEIRNCLIVNNTSNYYGGGLYATGSNTKTKVYNSTIANNSTNSQFVGGQAEIYNSIFWGNELTLVSNPVLTVSSSCIQGYTSGTGVIDTNPLFNEPTAGNGIAFNGLTANWSLRWCSPCFETGNSSLVPLGLTSDLGGNPRILYSSVDMGAYELDTTSLTPNAIGFANNRIYVSDSTHYFGNGSNWASALAGNAESCKYPGQTLLCEAMKDAVPGTEIWVTKGVFKSTLVSNRNHSFTLADGVLLFGGFAGNESSPYQRDTSSKSVFSGNIGDTVQTTDNSCHILNINPNAIIYNENAVIDGFKISNANANGTLNNSKGAGIFINSNSKVAISNSIIEVNNSTGNGAGIFINPNSEVVLSKCNIVNNTSAASGAGIYNEGNLQLDSCKINYNRYGSVGGGIYNSDSLLLSVCEVDSNYTVATNSKAGGIYNAGFCRIANSKIAKNKSRLEAGGILNVAGSVMELNGADVVNNSCVMGYSDANGGGVANSGSINVVGSNISNNAASNNGGGFFNNLYAICNISQSTIAYNSAVAGWTPMGGGGICNSGVLNINSSIISNNQTTGNGGGLYNPTLVKNCLVVNNSKLGNYKIGGGIWLGSACQGIFNSTIMNNSDYGIAAASISGVGQLIVSPDTFNLKNCIVYGNQLHIVGHFNIGNSCIQRILPESTNILHDPRCSNPSSGIGTAFDGLMSDWGLSSYSPCINKGNIDYLSAVDSIDVVGNQRVFGSTVDMGAFEYQSQATVAANQDWNYVKWEGYNPKVDNIQTNVDFPSRIDTIYTLETAIVSDANFQSRVRGYIIPNQTGYFRFYIASDYGGEFYLSPDSIESNKTRICFNQYGSQEYSATSFIVDSVFLAMGEPYFFEAFCNNYNANISGSYVKIGWKMPGNSAIQLITGNFLRPYLPINPYFGAGPYFVKMHASSTASGLSWDDPIDLTTLLDAFNNGKTRKMANVYVAEGVYMPTETIDRTKTFPMYNVRLVGGFDSLSTAIDTTLRNMNLNETIFSGEIGNPLTITDNSYHVVESNGQSVIDGLTIRDGAALIAMYGDENYAYNRGGGIYVSQFGRLSLKNCNVTNNCSWYHGGGVFTFSGSSINVENCIFTGNYNAQVASGGGIIVVVVNVGGGTLFCSNSSIHAKNSYFYDDASFAPIFIESNYNVGEFENCTFEGSGNSPVITSRSGARVYLTNCTVNAGLTSNVGGTFYIKNSTILGDISFAILRNTSHAYIDNSIITSQNVSDTLISAQYSILGQTLVGSNKWDIINDSIPSVTSWLDSLAYNGGLTPTMKLKNVPNNPAKSTGNLQYLGTTDQRGALRIDSVSIGAYQYDYPYAGIIQVKAFPEGLFNPATNSLSKSRNAFGEQFGGVIADKITLELHQATAPFSLIGTAFSANLLTTGYAHSMATTALPDSFYIVVKHRNSLETWSSAPVTPINSLAQYDFTKQINSAFGNNLKPLGSYFGLYSGDVNQDGIIDALDMIPVDNLSASHGMGYLPEDINGDGVIGTSDLLLINANSDMFIGKVVPQ